MNILLIYINGENTRIYNIPCTDGIVPQIEKLSGIVINGQEELDNNVYATFDEYEYSGALAKYAIESGYKFDSGEVVLHTITYVE